MTDLAWRLLRHGYSAVARDRAGRAASDDYPSRLLGRRALVVRSHDGVRTFYDEAIVRRKGAVPPPLAWLLFGRGAVHDAEHRARKRLLFDLTAPSGLIPAIDAADVTCAPRPRAGRPRARSISTTSWCRCTAARQWSGAGSG